MTAEASDLAPAEESGLLTFAQVRDGLAQAASAAGITVHVPWDAGPGDGDERPGCAFLPLDALAAFTAPEPGYVPRQYLEGREEELGLTQELVDSHTRESTYVYRHWVENARQAHAVGYPYDDFTTTSFTLHCPPDIDSLVPALSDAFPHHELFDHDLFDHEAGAGPMTVAPRVIDSDGYGAVLRRHFAFDREGLVTAMESVAEDAAQVGVTAGELDQRLSALASTGPSSVFDMDLVLAGWSNDEIATANEWDDWQHYVPTRWIRDLRMPFAILAWMRDQDIRSYFQSHVSGVLLRGATLSDIRDLHAAGLLLKKEGDWWFPGVTPADILEAEERLPKKTCADMREHWFRPQDAIRAALIDRLPRKPSLVVWAASEGGSDYDTLAKATRLLDRAIRADTSGFWVLHTATDDQRHATFLESAFELGAEVRALVAALPDDLLDAACRVLDCFERNPESGRFPQWNGGTRAAMLVHWLAPSLAAGVGDVALTLLSGGWEGDSPEGLAATAKAL